MSIERTPDLLAELEAAWALRASDRERCRALSIELLERARGAKDLRAEGYAARNLGFCDYSVSNYEYALISLSRGVEIAHALPDPLLLRDCYNYAGATYRALGDLDQALEHVQKTYELDKELGDRVGLANSLNNLGFIQLQLGRPEAALEALLEAVASYERLGQPARKALALINLALAHVDLRRFDEASRVSREVLELSRAQGLKDLEARALVNWGEALGLEGRPREATEALEAALALIRQEGLREGLPYALLNLGTIHAARHDYAGAIEVFWQGLDEAIAIGAKETQYQIHARLSEVFKAQAEFAAALEHFERYHALEREVRRQQTEQKIRAFGAQRELEKARAEAEIERLRNVELARALEALEMAALEKTALLGQLELQAVQDPLTEVFNRRYLESRLSLEFAQAGLAGSPLPVALMDIDNFKSVNDNFSHQTGDRVLQAVAHILRSSTREGDIVARYGGEEFVVVLPRVSVAAALEVCERIRHSVESHDWSQIHPDLRITLSLGLAADTSLTDHEKLLDLADSKLYQAKRGGKNRVCH